MEYLKPIEQLQASVKRYQVIVVALIAVLTLSILFTPIISKNGNPLVLVQDGMAELAETKAWQLSIYRIEGFAKAYASARFEWTADHFSKKTEILKSLVSRSVFQKMKTSVTAFQAIAEKQSGKSYFVWEGLGVSNLKKKIEIKLIRVILIKEVPLATPLTIRLSYEDTAITKENPYGLLISGIEEVERSTDPTGSGS